MPVATKPPQLDILDPATIAGKMRAMDLHGDEPFPGWNNGRELIKKEPEEGATTEMPSTGIVNDDVDIGQKVGFFYGQPYDPDLAQLAHDWFTKNHTPLAPGEWPPCGNYIVKMYYDPEKMEIVREVIPEQVLLANKPYNG